MFSPSGTGRTNRLPTPNTDLDSGVLYYITAIAGRYFPDRDQAQWRDRGNRQLATPN